MRKGETIPKKFTLEVINSAAGLWVVTSPEIHGLLVADTDMRSAIREVPDAIRAMQEALESNTTSDSDLESAGAVRATGTFTLGDCTALSVCPAW